MAPIHQEESLADSVSLPTRDHHADADSTRQRKRPRLSEEVESKEDASPSAQSHSASVNAPSSSASPVGSPFIEVGPPEDIGADPTTIIIDDDDSITGDTYLGDFPCEKFGEDYLEPLSAIRAFTLYANSSNHMEYAYIECFLEWLVNHVNATAGDKSSWTEKYLGDEDFWDQAALLCLEINKHRTLFPSNQRVAPSSAVWVYEGLLTCYTALCSRLLPLILDNHEGAQKRRDSGPSARQGKSRVTLLDYVTVTGQLLSLRSPLAELMMKRYHMKVQPLISSLAGRLLQSEDALVSLVTLLKAVSAAPNEFERAWDAILGGFQIAATVSEHIWELQKRPYPEKAFEEMIEVAHNLVLPAVSKKHPNVLPAQFHETVVSLTRTIVLNHVKLVDYNAAYSMYARYIENADDGLLPESANGGSVMLLQELCSGENELLAELLGAAWKVQALKDYIFSDIMGVRAIGMHVLSLGLVDYYQRFQRDSEDAGHPLLQYLARFLRTNHLTQYIMGANSHADLVRNSYNVIGFLAATNTYTKQETDVIWDAATNNVEADFVQAAFDALTTVTNLMTFENLQYLASKYETTPTEKLSRRAAPFLEHLLVTIQNKMEKPGDQMFTLRTSLKVLQNISVPTATEEALTLRKTVLNELHRVADAPFTQKDRRELVQHCVQAIRQCEAPAQRSIEAVVAIFGRPGQPVWMPDLEDIVDILPQDALIRELCSYIRKCREARRDQIDLDPLALRLNLLLPVMFRDSAIVDLDLEGELWTHLVAENAVDDAARNYAWQRLSQLASEYKGHKSCTDFLKRCVETHLPTLSPEYATPHLVQFLNPFIMARLRELTSTLHETDTFHIPFVDVLQQLAFQAPDKEVAKHAMSFICSLLFKASLELRIEKPAIVHTQVVFTRRCIQDLDANAKELRSNFSEVCFRQFTRRLDLLRSLLLSSQNTLREFNPPAAPEVPVIGKTDNVEPRVLVTLQLHTGASAPTIKRVEASLDATIADIAEHVKAEARCEDVKVIANGHMIEPSQTGGKTLKSLGFTTSGVLMIRLLYDPHADPAEVLTRPGPLEQAVADRLESLESYLDDRDEVANKTFDFLVTLPPPASTRHRVMSANVTADELFPSDRRWKTTYHVNILTKHLSDQARLGIADEDFILRGIHLLIELIMDASRSVWPELLLKSIEALRMFLLERPAIDLSAQYFFRPTAFVSRIFALLEYAKALPKDVPLQPAAPHIRPVLAYTLYATLLDAVRLDNNVWKAITDSPAVVPLHSRLLLDEDVRFTSKIVKCIEDISLEAQKSKELNSFYWRLFSDILPEGQRRPHHAFDFFKTAPILLAQDSRATSSEDTMQALVASLSGMLLRDGHLESLDSPMRDHSTWGLAKLLQESITFFRKIKKCADFGNMPTELYTRLLFSTTPLRSEETRDTILDIVYSTATSAGQYRNLLHHVTRLSRSVGRAELPRYSKPEDWTRRALSHAGLANLGQTCYMNSLIQQLYHNVAFRKFILDASIVDSDKQILLVQVQELFARMQESSEPVIDTFDLAKALCVQVDNQEDVHSFYAMLLGGLEENMPDATLKVECSAFFSGKQRSQIRGECGHVSERVESFNDMSIVVKNKTNLMDGLNEFVQGEPLEGADRYKCMTCDSASGGRLVNAMKRTALEDVPDNLTFSLKRFSFEAMMGDGTKVNDRFDFPLEIDMATYKLSHLANPEAPFESDMFELVGVIVHLGSLQIGHYWSYVRVRGQPEDKESVWVRLEDRKTRPTTIEELRNESLGGDVFGTGFTRNENAYVLFYQRRSSIAAACNVTVERSDRDRVFCLPPRVQLPLSLGVKIEGENEVRTRFAHLVEPKHQSFVLGLMAGLANFDDQLGSLAKHATGMGVAFLTDICLKTEAGDGFIEVSERLCRFATQDPACANLIVTRLLEEYVLEAVLFHGKAAVRHSGVTLILQCLEQLREHEPVLYGLDPSLVELRLDQQAAFCSLAAAVAKLKVKLCSHRHFWKEYFRLAAALAKMGPRETAFLLDHKMLAYCFEIWNIDSDEVAQRKHDRLWRHYNNGVNLDWEALLFFIEAVISEHVDLRDVEQPSSSINNHDVLEHGCLLTKWEWDRLFATVSIHKSKGFKVSRLVWLAVKRLGYSHSGVYQDSLPGKLVGTLASERVSRDGQQLMLATLLDRLDNESNDITPYIQMATHFCRHHDEPATVAILIKNIAEAVTTRYTDHEIDSLVFFTEVFSANPSAVMETVAQWAPDWLTDNNIEIRAGTEGFLKDMLFNPKPVTLPQTVDTAMLDAKRVRTVCVLCDECSKLLVSAYQGDKSRSTYQFMIDVVQEGVQYLARLDREARKLETVQTTSEEQTSSQSAAEQPTERLSLPLATEWQESKPVRDKLVQDLQRMSDWPFEDPTDIYRVRRSVEAGDDDDDAEFDDEYFSDDDYNSDR